MGLKNYKCILKIGNYLSNISFFYFCLFIFVFNSHREEITAERLTPFRVFMISNPREKFTAGEVSFII